MDVSNGSTDSAEGPVVQCANGLRSGIGEIPTACSRKMDVLDTRFFASPDLLPRRARPSVPGLTRLVEHMQGLVADLANSAPHLVPPLTVPSSRISPMTKISWPWLIWCQIVCSTLRKAGPSL